MTPARHTISFRLFFIASLCGGLILIATLFAYEGYRSMKSSILEGAETSIGYAVKAIEQSVKNNMTTASINLSVLEETTIGTADTLAKRLDILPTMAKILKSNPIVEAVFIGYPTGELFYLRKSSPAFKSILPDFPLQYSFSLTSLHLSNGNLVRSVWAVDKTLEHMIPLESSGPIMEVTKRNWYQLAIKNNGIMGTRPYLFFFTGELGITMSKKVRNGGAVIGIDILTDNLKDVLLSLRITPHTEMAISDSTNELAAYTKTYAPSPEEIGPDGSIQVSRLGVPIFDKLLLPEAPSNTVVPYQQDKDTWYGFSVLLGGYYGNPLRLLVAIPGSELLYTAKLDMQGQGILLALTVIAFVMGGVLLSEWIFSPLQAISNHLNTLSQFNFTTPLRLSTIFREPEQLGRTLNRMAESLWSFQEMIRIVNQEKDQDKMFHDVLEHILGLLRLSAGRIYLREKNTFVLAASRGGPEDKTSLVLPEDKSEKDSIDVFLKKELGDSYLCVPLYSSSGMSLGAVCVDSSGNRYTQRKDRWEGLYRYLANIASAAAIGIETRQLIAAQQALLEGIIHAIANGIDAKSPYTGGHCKRVPQLALMLAEAASESTLPSFDSFHLSSEAANEFRIAAWLHDCGKLTTPEYVVDKATKLETIYNRIHEIRTRFEVLHRDAIIRCYAAIQAGKDEKEAWEECRKEHAKLQEDFAFIAQCNIGDESMQDDHIERLQKIAVTPWQRNYNNLLGLSKNEQERCINEANDSFPIEETLLSDREAHLIPWEKGIPHVRKDDPENTLGFDMVPPLYQYNQGELYNLSIKRGTLTAEERFMINDHIIQTLVMLYSLPWPPNLKNVPDIAGNHHETLDGKGYPRKLTEKDLSIQERIMALADVFEALTAPDRPYKDGKKLSVALDILANMAKNNHIDKNVFSLFITSGVYMQYAEAFIKPEQVDAVDETACLKKAGL